MMRQLNWKYTILIIILSCILLVSVFEAGVRSVAPSSTHGLVRSAHPTRIETNAKEDGGDDLLITTLQRELSLHKLRVAELESEIVTSPKVIFVNRTEYVTRPPPLDPNPLKLPSYLNVECENDDIIALQRWIVERQHAYTEDVHTESSQQVNPDPDPYCTSTKLLIDTVPSYYVWSEADLLQEAMAESVRQGRMPATQRLILPEVELPSGRQPRRITGFGIAAQIHIIAARMIYAWQHGYTYVNLARSAWTKGIRRQTMSDGAMDPWPFQNDHNYWLNAPWTQTSPSLDTSLFHGTCTKGGIDCFFRSHTSLGCLLRAEGIVEEVRHFPKLNDFNRQKVKELEQRYQVLIDPDLEQDLKQATFTKFNNKNKKNMKNTTPSTPSPSGPTIHLDPSIENDVSVSNNPWSLPGLDLSSSSSSSSSRGDLFLLSETLRFLMRPNRWTRLKLKSTLEEMKFPGFTTSTGTGSEDQTEEDGGSQSVIGVHFRRNLDGRSQSLIAIHKSEEYILLIQRLTNILGTRHVFLSLDDPSKFDHLQHVLGSGSERDPGLGLDILHLPTHLMSQVPIPYVIPPKYGKLTIQQRLAGPDASDQARQLLQGLKDEEGVHLLNSLYIMGIFTSGFVGTVSSHWGRIVMELQRWQEGRCQPPKYDSTIEWILPKNDQQTTNRVSNAKHTSKDMDTATNGSSRSRSTSTFQPLFIDMDGDTYFIGDFKNVRHTHIPQANSPHLDPSRDE